MRIGTPAGLRLARGAGSLYNGRGHAFEANALNLRSIPRPDWKRTLYAIAAGELLAVAGFTTSTPIIPFYLQDLGVSDPFRLKLLTGLLQALPSVSLVFFSPIWGSLADNYGRKPMLLRALFGGVLIMLLQGLVTAPWQLLALRTLQGCITGTIAAATILVASVAPQEEVGYALGLLQMAIFLGATFGPLFGGVIADVFGRRINFFATSGLLLAAGVIISRFAVDNFKAPENRKSIFRSLLPDFTPVIRSRALASLLAVIAADQIAGSIVGPFLPLYIQHLIPESTTVATTTGVVIGLGALASALAAASIGKVSYRFGYKRTLVVCMAGASLFMIPQAFARTPLQLLLMRVGSCFFVGGNLPSVNALIAQRVEPGRQGSTFGLSAAIASASNAMGPVIGASIALAAGFSAVFLTTAGILGAAGIVITLFVRGPRKDSRGPSETTAG
jgi:MFS transporter, DHA1 family, multidrug resistance protein